ncbi:MAG: hypothetical protein CMJ06_06055 [Pelagibacterales bacterium]|nr:hypothetical protein [Pelagibacterales bacterium]OUU61198.1 MAG: hypothetical protein CBC22_08200 [Alphaproteobacteria bacterium TMED62]|tara:strand:- start:10927 stop:11397 length:471 start_codon:yes stop_codon:yes gene_type:complete
MVAQFNFRLILYLLLFFTFHTTLISEDKMDNLNIDIKTAVKNYNANELKIIDIRTLKEWKMTGIIPNSYLINMHNEDFSENINFLEKVKKIINENQKHDIAFICASGARSEIVASYFKEKNYANIFNIPKGILGKSKDGWLFLGYPIESYIDKNGN